MAGLSLKYNTKLYTGNAGDFTADKDKVFAENVLLFNTFSKKLYLGDGKTKLQSLTEINNASTDLSDYVKEADLEDYAEKTDLDNYIKTAAWSDQDDTVSEDGVWYVDPATGVYIGDGETQVKSLTPFLEVAGD